jgi:hypothetical protein
VIEEGYNLPKENINHTENGQDKETVTWKTVGETTDAIFGLVFSLMMILVNTLHFMDVKEHSVF